MTSAEHLYHVNDDELNCFIETANKVVDTANDVIREYSSKNSDIDGINESVLDIARKRAEEAMTSIIQAKFNSHVVIGKVTGWTCKQKSANPDFIWVLHPLHSGQNFITYKTLFSTVIALLYKNNPVIGIIDRYIPRLRWIGISGRQTTENGEEVSVRMVEQMDQAFVDIKGCNYNDDAKFAYTRVAYKVKQVYYDGNCVAYGQLAAGFLNLVIHCNVDPTLLHALIPIVEGAGGVVTDWKGHLFSIEVSPYSLSTSGGFKVLAAGDKQIHKKAIEELAIY